MFKPENTKLFLSQWWHANSFTTTAKSFRADRPWWRHQMETFSALVTICAGNSPISGEFPAQRPVTRSFDVFFDLGLNKRLSKPSCGWWFETLPRPLWRHSNVECRAYVCAYRQKYSPKHAFFNYGLMYNNMYIPRPTGLHINCCVSWFSGIVLTREYH